MISYRCNTPILLNIAAVVLLLAAAGTHAETPQERVHRMSHHAMPFDISSTVHIFRMTESGGVLRVLARNPDDNGQIARIRQHLNHEGKRFDDGDYSDPAKLHGADMPGLAELQANASQVEVSYAELENGAQLTFETDRLQLITAIHRWFGAQLSEHGADARAE